MAKTSAERREPESGSTPEELPPAVAKLQIGEEIELLGEGARLAAALVAAQAALPKVEPNATNPHFNSKFVSLDHLLAKVRPILNANGLAVVQMPTFGPAGEPALRTYLVHESGEQISDVMPLLAAKSDPQGQGSALTYARRYSLAALLGISSETDDDANAARTSSGGASGAEPSEPITWENLAPGTTLHPEAPKGWKEIDATLKAIDPSLDRKALVAEILKQAYDASTVAELGDNAQEAGRRLANLAGFLRDVTMEGREFPPPMEQEYEAAIAWAFSGMVMLVGDLIAPAEEPEVPA